MYLGEIYMKLTADKSSLTLSAAMEMDHKAPVWDEISSSNVPDDKSKSCKVPVCGKKIFTENL